MAGPQDNTIQYCIDNNVPCFTFKMDATKKCQVRWRQVTAANFRNYIRHGDNGFAILTGNQYVVIDLDLKHAPPQYIYDTLWEGCAAVEKTPGGFHFWFLRDGPAAALATKTAVEWNGFRTPGLDIRAAGGICYCAPSTYIGTDGTIMEYKWIKGTLSTADSMPVSLLNYFIAPPSQRPQPHATPNNTEILIILASLSQHRVDDYDSWIHIGMALKNSGYSCDVWDEWSAFSPKYTPGECNRKWHTFLNVPAGPTIATIYYYLKQDNYPVFMDTFRHTAETHIMSATNADVARLFYNMNKCKYMYSPSEGWFVLQENGTWSVTGSNDVYRVPNILNDISTQCTDIILDAMSHLDGTRNADMMKQRTLADALKKVSTHCFLKGAVAFLPDLYLRPRIEAQMNQKHHLFAFTNGVYDSNEGRFRPIEPDDYISVTCGYDYRPPTSQEKEMVLEFLRQIWPNEAVLKYGLASLARSLRGDNIDQVFHVFTGRGANGKSCLMDLCRLTFGDYYQTFSVSYLTKESDAKDRPLPELAAARYARMLVTSEPDERDRFQVSLLKVITGNEEISFRGMYAKMPTKYVPQFKLWILTNDMPRLSKYDQAIERRMRCVHFPTRFVYEPRTEDEALRDDTLAHQFREHDGWRYGLLGLLIDAVSKERLQMPQQVREFTEEYMLQNNPVGAWLRQHYHITGRRDDIIQKTELYRAYLEDGGQHVSIKEFHNAIDKCNINEKKDATGTRYYIGLVRKNTE